jgi:CRISPR system Cascade subunit CasA
MNYNLIHDQWVSVKKSNTSETFKIRTEQIADPQWKTINAPRADLKGALFQFLIGLLQTAFTPDDREQWEEYWESPPSEEMLKKAFEPFHEAFYLNVEGKPAFMQDSDLPEEAKVEPIERLLIGSASENGIKKNTDHFIKREKIIDVSPYWAALSLFSLQINAPEGGSGHRVGIRGGGPLTTLVMPPHNIATDSLWHKLWLNVLTKVEMEHVSGNSELNDNKYIFPWLSKTRVSTSKKINKKTTYIDGGRPTTEFDVNPLQMYWSMPRRIRIDWGNNKPSTCDISGEVTDNPVAEYKTKNFGTDYSGYWIHPLSAYDLMPDKEPNSVKAQPGGLSYRYWVGLVIENIEKHRQPALIVRSYKEWRCESINGTEDAQLWAFGYDMKSADPRCWYEASMPVFHVPKLQLAELGYQIPKLIEAASDVLKTLKQSLKMAWFKRPKDAKGDISFIDHSFLEQTESTFYKQLRCLINQLDDDNAIQITLNEWRKSLQHHAVKVFDDYVLCSMNEDGDMKRIIQSRKYLEKWLNNSKPMKALKVA